MNRRSVLAGLTLAGIGGVIGLRPRDQGAPYEPYFQALNQELKANGPMRPVMVIDLDQLERNLDLVTATLRRSGKHYRIVEKSLPCPRLLAHIAQRAGTKRLMSFHQPFLNHDAALFPDSDLLLGKPLPVGSAQRFYQGLKGSFDPAQQLQWLIDTPQRLDQYLELAKALNTRMRINIEIDVGLHRGGVQDTIMLAAMLDRISAQPQYLEFSGFMGYDAHVGMGVPSILGSESELLARAMSQYQIYVDFARTNYPKLWHAELTLNTGGSPSYKLHEAEALSTEISVGTALVKPTHYDLKTLHDHVPAAFIATPVLKATGPVRLPALDEKSRIFSWWDVNQRQTYFIYGGYWLAKYESPRGLQFNKLYGHSANQEIVNGSPLTGLGVDDHVFLRPEISEGVLLQFGDLLILRGGKIIDQWPVLDATG